MLNQGPFGMLEPGQLPIFLHFWLIFINVMYVEILLYAKKPSKCYLKAEITMH